MTMNSFTVDRRTFLKGTGGFLAVSFALPGTALAAGEAAAKLPGDLEDYPMLSSWIRINADGTVTLMIGKVELGQGAVTAVAQVCAEELVVDLDRLHVISGDIFVSPDEGTTAGSQTMQNCASAVQQAAAEVRQILRDMAAEKLGADAESLT